MKSPSAFLHQSRLSTNSMYRSSIGETLRKCPSTVSFSTEDVHLVYKNSSNERLKKASSIDPSRVNQPLPTTLHPSYHSQRSLIDDDKEQIWIKRRLSNSTIEKIFDRRKPFLWKEIIDVTV
jgi:hypothetical protein